MLVNDRMPPKARAERLARIFGAAEGGKKFYSTSSWQSLIDPNQRVERVYKTADQAQITEFLVDRLRGKFAAVAEPGLLYNSKGLLFVLLFATGNERGAKTAFKIANDLLRDLSWSPL